MKKFWKSMMFAVLSIFVLSSCEDVPAPYPIPNGGGNGESDAAIYQSKNLNAGWTAIALTDDNPWSMGANYAQATGYQDWEGTGTKSNREVRGYLVSPAISTKSDEGKVKFTFDNCLMYSNNDSKYVDHCKVFLSKEFDGDPEGCNWTEVTDFKVTPATGSWVFNNAGEFQLPEEFVNQEKVFFAFYFEAPATKSTTWEVQNFKVEQGEAQENIEPETPVTEITCEQAVELTNALADGATSNEKYAVTGYITEIASNVNKNQQSFWMADTKDGGNVFEAYWANLPEGVTEFVKGSKVKITGNLTKYVKDGKVTAEIKNAEVEILEKGEEGETPIAGEITCAQAVELTNALADGATSNEKYAVTGYITEIVSNVSKNQQSFWMADTKDGGNVFEAYYANLPDGVTEFVKGSKVRIVGNLTKYVKDGKVTAEIKNAVVEILEKGEEGETPTATEITCAQAVELTNALADGATSDEKYTVTGYITEIIGNVNNNQQSFWMADSKDGGKVFEAYWANLPSGVSAFTAGSKVKITGNLMKYVKDGKVTPEIKNAVVVILEGGGDNPDTPDTPTEGDITITAYNMGLSNNVAWSTITVNGITFTADGGGNNNTPKYFDNGTNLRLYPKNSLTLSASKKIESIVINCTSGSVANGNVGVEPGNVNVSDPTIIISDINSTSVKITNNDSSTGAASQIRIVSISIDFAE